MSLNSLQSTRSFQSLHSMFCGLNHTSAKKLNLNIDLEVVTFLVSTYRVRIFIVQWPASHA